MVNPRDKKIKAIIAITLILISTRAFGVVVEKGDLIDYIGVSAEHNIGVVKEVENWEGSHEQSIEVEFIGFFPTGYFIDTYKDDTFQYSKWTASILSSWVNKIKKDRFRIFVRDNKKWSTTLWE